MTGISQTLLLERVVPRSGLNLSPRAFDSHRREYAFNVVETAVSFFPAGPKFHLKDSAITFGLFSIHGSGVSFAWNRKPHGISALPDMPGFINNRIGDLEW
jgi:hypothetical protein